MNSGLRRTLSRAFGAFCAVLALSIGAPATAVEIAGVKLDDTARVANQELKLNGAGVRYRAIFQVYAAGLYLSDKKPTVSGVLSVPGPKRITLVMLRDIGNEELGRAFMAGIQKNSSHEEKTKIIPQLQTFGEIFASIPELKKGDVLTTDWIPGSGTVVHMNGKKVSDVIPDEAFYNALLRIWLGEKPADSGLKTALLGGE